MPIKTEWIILLNYPWSHLIPIKIKKIKNTVLFVKYGLDTDMLSEKIQTTMKAMNQQPIVPIAIEYGTVMLNVRVLFR
jgi:hypothetical protein